MRDLTGRDSMGRGLMALGLVLVVVTLGCGSEHSAPPAPAAASLPPASAPLGELAPSAPAAPAMLAAPAMPAAGHEGRDPFEPSVTPAASPPAPDVRPRKSKRFSIDELKLVGIVSGTDQTRAMLVDPRGKGWVVTRGEIIGRAEILHDSQGDHAVSWKVDRIRESDVILVREDASHSLVPSSTRVLALRHEAVASDDQLVDD